MLNIRRIFVGIVTAFCLVAVVWAGEKKESAKIECIWEKKFDFLPNLEERRASGITIRGDEVIFDDAEVSAKEAKGLAFRGYEKVRDNEKVIIPYPKVMIGRSNIIFLDVRGNIKRKYYLGEWAEVGFSKNEKFIGILGLGKKKKERVFTMLDRDGNVLWKTDITRVGYTLPYISPNGEYVIAEGDPSYDLCDYYPSIWDKNGLVKGLVEEGTKAEIEKIDFTEDGKHFVIAFETSSVETTNHMIKTNTGEELPYLKLKKSIIISLFTKECKKVWGQKLEGSSRGIAVSRMGNYVAIARKKSRGTKSNNLLLFNANGSKLWENSISFGQVKMLFLKDETILGVVTGWGGFHCFETSTGRIVGEYNKHSNKGVWNPNYIYRKIVINGNSNIFLLVGFVPRYAEKNIPRADFIDLVDKNGRLILTSSFPRKKLFGNKETPDIEIFNCTLVGLDHLSSKLVFYNTLVNKEEQ